MVENFSSFKLREIVLYTFQVFLGLTFSKFDITIFHCQFSSFCVYFLVHNLEMNKSFVTNLYFVLTFVLLTETY